jgi:hypothetical protein
MNEADIEIGQMVGKAIGSSIQESFGRLERLLERMAPATTNAQPSPTVISTGGGQPVINVDTRTLGEAIGAAVAEALAPVLNELAEGREQVAQLAQVLAGMELRPTINVPEAAVHVEVPTPAVRQFTIEHEDGSKSKVTVE